jgi:hypothetical protein
MSISEEIKAIIADATISFEDKRKKLLKLMTLQEVNALLPKPAEVIRLKHPYGSSPKGTGSLNLNLSVVKPIFDSVLNGNHIECRDYNGYFKDKCTYVEDGERYLIPFDTITFYVGKGKYAKWAKSVVTNITCDGDCLYFYLGQVIDFKV